MGYRLQAYDDNTFGYLGIDGDKYNKYNSEAKVVCTQGEYESREDFIKSNRLEIDQDQYGYNERLDYLFVNSDDYECREMAAIDGYALDKLVNDRKWEVRVIVARHCYGLAKLVDDKSWRVRYEVANQGYGFATLRYDDNEKVRQVVKNYEDKLKRFRSKIMDVKSKVI